MTQPVHQRSCDVHPKWAPGCDGCNAQNRRYMIRRKLLASRGKRLSTGAEVTIERLRQLRAAGHSSPVLAAASGIHPNYILELSSGRIDWVQLKTFHAVEKLYRELRDVPGTDMRAAGYAQKQGWAPPPPASMPPPIPETHVDEIAVERAMAGDRVPLTRAESSEAWGRLEARGLPAKEIARLLHTSQKTVERWRSGQIRRPSSTRARAKRSA